MISVSKKCRRPQKRAAHPINSVLVHNVRDYGRDTCGLECFHTAEFQIGRTSTSVRPDLSPPPTPAQYISNNLCASCSSTSTQPLTPLGMWTVMSWGSSNKKIERSAESNQSMAVPLLLYNIWGIKKKICANAVSKRPPSSVLKGHRLALVPASHSLKHLSMAFLLSQLPTLTVGMILRGWSHWTKRFSSRKLLCSLYGIPVRKGRREPFFQGCLFLFFSNHWNRLYVAFSV